MNKKKLCATLTLSAFAASLLPGMAFAEDTPDSFLPEDVTVSTQEITLTLGSSATWLNEGDTITITKGIVDVKDNFTLTLVNDGAGIKLVPKDALKTGKYVVEAKNTNKNEGEGEDGSETGNWEIEVAGIAEYTFAPDSVDGKITFTGDDAVGEGDVLRLLKADGTAGAKITDSEGSNIAIGDGGKLSMSADLLVAGKYAITAPDADVIKAYVVYTEALAEKLAEANKEVITKAQNVADAIPSTLDVSVGSNGTGDVLETVKGNADVVKALNDNGFEDDSVITIKTAKGDIAEYINGDLAGGITVSGDVTGTVVYDVAGKATKEVAVTVVKADDIADVVKAYIAENFADNYDEAAKTATVTMKKGDAFNMTLADATVSGALKANNKILLSSSKVAVDSQYIDLENGLITAAPAEDYKTTLTLKFVDKTETALTDAVITIDLTIAADVPGEFDPTDDFTKEELEALDEAQLAEVKEVADQAKADALAARNAKSEAAAKDYADQGLDLSKPEDLAKATELYLSYSAERKAYKEAKAYAALVDEVIAAGK